MLRTLALLVLGFAVPAALSAATPLRPNIVVILADDLGYGDLNLNVPGVAAFRNPHIRTPHLAALARQSLVFTHHYASAPVCSPSRAGLLTGRTPTRQNIMLFIKDLTDNDKVFLRGEEITVAEILKASGYDTAVIGKWHLNGADWEVRENWTGWTGSFPRQQGFNYAMVTKENPHIARDLAKNTQKNPGDFFYNDGEPAGVIEGYSSQIITDAAVQWLKEKRAKEKPFFLYLPYDAVHEIISNPPEYSRIYDTGIAEKNEYYANITYLDAQIGRFIRALDEMGLGENTLVIFSSDNGPDELNCNNLTARSYGTSYPLFGQKRQLFEGGLRVPGLMRCPAKIKPRFSAAPNSTLDLLPTLTELAGGNLPQDRALDGVSLAPHLLEGREIVRAKPLYWQVEIKAHYEMTGEGYDRRFDGSKPRRDAPTPQVAVRMGNHVLRGMHSGAPFTIPVRYEMFDVAHDPEENHDLAPSKPPEFSRLLGQLKAMHAEVNAERVSGRVLDFRPAARR